MSPLKRFILAVAAVSFAVWLAGNLLWGPPDYSAEYLAEYKQEHDQYLIITKSEAYKRYLQRPHLNGPDGPHAPTNFAEQLAFVETYESRAEFQAEQRRRGIYHFYFEVFNAALLLFVAGWLGWKPLVNYLDSQIAELRETMETNAAEREAAEAKFTETKSKLRGFDKVKQEIASDTLSRIGYDLDELKKTHTVNRQHFAQELADRKVLAERRAVRRVKWELVQLAANELEEQAKNATPERHAAWIDAFGEEVEKLA